VVLKITVIALGNKMPEWVTKGTEDYVKRFNNTVQLKLIEIPLITRTKTSDLNRILKQETALIREALPSGARLIALDSKGKSFTSDALANHLTHIQLLSSHLCFIIGGPEGLSEDILTLSDEQWSLSQLTLPHPLVRIVLIEALYRAWSIILHHPYHK
jgi:23S rRNA (pseudouridine1915-N3)-methyltransferase